VAVEGLTIIGESINDSVPSTHKLFEDGDLEGIKNLAKTQDEAGAAYIDVNVGLRSPGFMGQMVREIQLLTAKPISIDTPDPAIAAAGLEAYDPGRAGGKLPIVNSISATRIGMFDLARIRAFMPILLTSEREQDGGAAPNRSGRDNYETARHLRSVALEYGIPNEHLIFDPGIAPIGTDTEGILKMVLESMELMHNDPAFAGAHMSVGLSNFTVMLPVKKADGSPVKGPLESAFITLAKPRGLDFVIGSVKRNYQLLAADHPAMECLGDVLAANGYDCVTRVMTYYG
jgi:5-methyltetrahydrofolate corrinoid/iron sulfur protein methyltransferase